MAVDNLKGKDSYVYFLYSESQFKERSEIEGKMSREFIPGIIIINGKKVKFTEISRKNSNRYPDCKVVAEGYKSKVKYTNIYTVAKRI